MDGNWNKWYLVPVYLLGSLITLPRAIRNKLFPRPKAPNPSRWDDMPVTDEEDEAWAEMEKKQ